MIRTRFKLRYKRDVVLKKAPNVISKHIRRGLEILGRRLRTSSASRMRKNTGAEARSLQIQVTGNFLDLELRVFSTLIRAYIDAYGLPRGVFPPYGLGTPLYRWALTKANGNSFKRVKTVKDIRSVRTLTRNRSKSRRELVASKAQKVNPITEKATSVLSRGQRSARAQARRTAYLVARSIYQKGIRATHWNTRALDANKSRIIREMQNSLARAANELRRG